MLSKINAYLALILALAQLKYLSCEDPADLPKSRIVGGVPADILSFPYLIGIRTAGTFICGGSLITSQCVLTAAHCVYDRKASDLEILAGSTIVNTGISRKVKNIFLSTSFDSDWIEDMDVAIMKLWQPLRNRRTRTIEIDYTPVQEGDTISLAGWGRLSYNGSYPQCIHAANLNAISNDVCKDIYGSPPFHFTDNMFCTLGKGKDACDGDSGGPAMRNGRQVGIVSWGVECGSDKFPGVYTKLSSPQVRSFVDIVISTFC